MLPRRVARRARARDCGLADACATDPRGHLGFGLWFASEPVLAPGEGLGGQLARLGLAPRDIDAVVLTHLDCDHANGLADIAGADHITRTNDIASAADAAGAKAYYVSAEELATGNKGGARYNPHFWAGIDFRELSFTPDQASPFGRSCDLFGDGSLICHFTPTHSAGSLCVEVRGDNACVDDKTRTAGEASSGDKACSGDASHTACEASPGDNA